jgi:dihydroflavonol-4-reductase
MKAFVTGATGFIGTHLVKRLIHDGHEVTILVHRREPIGLEGLPVRAVTGSLDDLEALAEHMSGADAVFHLAAAVSTDPKDAPMLHRINTLGTEHIVQACLQTGVKRLVHTSSVHALESAPGSGRFHEESPLALGAHHHPYDRTKAAGEAAVLEGVKSGLHAVILNPGGAMGPEDYAPTPVGEMLLQLYHHQMPGLIDGGFYWVDARDVVEGILLAHESGQPGERYILTGEYATIPDIARIIREITGASTPRLVTPMWLAKLVAPLVAGYCALRGTKPLYTRASLTMLCSHQELSGQRAAEALGYQPRPIRETLKDTFAWFEQTGRLSRPDR